MSIEDRLSELVREAIEPMLTTALNDLEERLAERLAGLVQTKVEAPLLLTQDGVAAYLGVAPRTVQRMVSAGEFPAPIRITPGTARWRREDVDGWLERRREP